MSPYLVIVALLLLIAGSMWLARYQQRRRLETQLHRLANRTAKPVGDRLEPQRQRVREAIDNVLQGLADGSARPGDVARTLPKFHSQVARIEHDQKAFDDISASRTRLRQWLDRLDGHHEDSDYQELREVASRAHRIVTGLIEDGELERAMEAAVEAEVLLKGQFEAIEASSRRLASVEVRLRDGIRQAEACNAPILVRARWERLMSSVADLEGLRRRGRISDALAAASRVQTELETLTQHLIEQLCNQIADQRAQASALFSELLLWPPDAKEQQAEVRDILETLEARQEPDSSPAPSLDVAREHFEQARALMERGVVLAREHKNRWERFVADLLARLETRSLQRLDTFRSLPETILSTRKELDRRRARIRRSHGLRPPWHVAEDIQEVLAGEQTLLQEVQALVSRARAAVEAAGSRLQRTSHILSAVSASRESLDTLKQRFGQVRTRLEQYDLATLDDDLTRLDADITRITATAAQAGLDRARQVLAAMDRALEVLTSGGLLPFAGSTGKRLLKDRDTLAAHVDRSDVIAALETAGTWAEDAPALVQNARRQKNRTRIETLRDQMMMDFVSELPGDTRTEVERDLETIARDMEVLETRLDDQEEFDRGCTEVAERVEATRQRALNAIEAQFQAQLTKHEDALARLTRSTVQFYLPDEAHEALTESRRLHDTCQARNRWSPLETLQHADALAAQTSKLQALWEDALPRARRFYRRQLDLLTIELEGVGRTGLSSDISDQFQDLELQTRELSEQLETDHWEEVAQRIDEVAGFVRTLADHADALRRLTRWYDDQEATLRALHSRLESLGCDQEARTLAEQLEAWDDAVSQGRPVEDLRALRAKLGQLADTGEAAAARALEEVERSRREQGELEAWRSVLAHRKQDLDWTRSSLKHLLGLGPDGIDLRRGLSILQALQRSLDIIDLDLDAAARHDHAFQTWLESVRGRAEQRFLEEFDDVIDALHERPASIKALCAEVLTHVDAVLSTGFVEDDELEEYERLQALGDDYHKLFTKRFSHEKGVVVAADASPFDATARSRAVQGKS